MILSERNKERIQELAGVTPKGKKGFVTNIEKDTVNNESYREVLYTSNHSQLVLMSLHPGEEIGEETHGNDQFFRIESGIGKIIINKEEYEVKDGSAAVIPAGATHNVINTSDSESLKLYSIYSPPHHKEGTIHKTKSDQQEETFDGSTTE